jgi:hypothetical protein
MKNALFSNILYIKNITQTCSKIIYQKKSKKRWININWSITFPNRKFNDEISFTIIIIKYFYYYFAKKINNHYYYLFFVIFKIHII